MTQEQATPPGFWQRIEQMIDRGVAKAMRSGALRNASIGEGGTFTIKGGQLRVLYPADEGGGVGVYFGAIQAVEDASYLGTGLMVQGPDGHDVATFSSDVDTGGTQVILRDSEGNPVMYTPSGGEGLVRPYIAGAFFRQRYADWTVATTAAVFEGLWKAEIRKQHARISVATQSSTSASGTTGELRVMVNGVQLGDVQAVDWGLRVDQFGPDEVAGENMEVLTVEIQGRVTGGAGSLKVEPLHLLGRG